MKVAVTIGNGQKVEQKFAYGLQMAEHATNAFSDGKVKDRVLSILKISKACLNVAQHNEVSSAFLKDGLDILHDELESCSSNNGDRFFTFGLKAAKVALLLSNNGDAERTLKHGLQLVEDAVDTFTDEKTRDRTMSLINIAKMGIRTLHTDGKPSELLTESLNILQNGLEYICPDNAKNILTLGVKTMKVALSDGNMEKVEETLKNGLHLAEETLNILEDGKMKQLTTTLLSIAKMGVRTLQPDQKPSEILKESLDILQGGLECVCPDNAGKFLTFGVKAMKVALSDGNDETLQNGLSLAEEALSTITDSRTKTLTTSLINVAKVAVRTQHNNENPCELLQESLDILQGGLECVCPESAKKYLAIGAKTVKIALEVGKGQTTDEQLEIGLKLTEDALNTFTDGRSKHITTSLINIAKVGIRTLQPEGKPSEFLTESLDILQNGLEYVCPDNAKNLLTFGVKTMKVALSDGHIQNVEDTLKNGLHLAEETLNIIEDGKMKQLTTSLLSIAKVGVRTLQPDGKPSEMLKESLDILQGGLESVCPDNAGKFLTFGVKAMKVALSDGNDETLKNGLFLAEEALSTITDSRTKTLTTSLINIAKIGVKSLQSNGKPSDFLQESLDILQDGIEHMCLDNAGNVLKFGIKTMTVVLSDGNSKHVGEILKNGIHLAEEAIKAFTDRKTKQLTRLLIRIVKVDVRVLQSNGKYSELLNEILDILQGSPGYMCPVMAEKFFSFGVNSMAVALVDDNDMKIEERLKNGVELAEQALNFFTDNEAKYLTKFVIEVGIRALRRDGKHSEVLKESLDVLRLGLEGYCDGTYYLVSENTRGFTNFKGNGDLKELLKHSVTLEIYSDKTKKDFEDLTKHCRKCRPNDRRNHIILIVKST